MKQFHDKILTRPNSSSKMTAICACMRKLLLILRGIVISGLPFNPDYVSNPNNRKMRAIAQLKQIAEA